MQMFVPLTIIDIVTGIIYEAVVHTLRRHLQGVYCIKLIHYSMMKSLISSDKPAGELVRVCIQKNVMQSASVWGGLSV